MVLGFFILFRRSFVRGIGLIIIYNLIVILGFLNWYVIFLFGFFVLVVKYVFCCLLVYVMLKNILLNFLVVGRLVGCSCNLKVYCG